MTDWFEVWQRKGRTATRDLRTLDGFESTRIDPEVVARQIADILQIRQGDRVLEVGCGAGMLAQYLPGDYTGVDYSPEMIAKFREIQAGKAAEVGSANRLRFADGEFDQVFAFSVFQYFPDKQYATDAVAELCRVARGRVFIGDLPRQSHSADHLLYSGSEFAGWQVEPGFYNPDRFNVWRDMRIAAA